jgi:hypothetical protein
MYTKLFVYSFTLCLLTLQTIMFVCSQGCLRYLSVTTLLLLLLLLALAE